MNSMFNQAYLTSIYFNNVYNTPYILPRIG
jgi:hypothetical protein